MNKTYLTKIYRETENKIFSLLRQIDFTTVTDDEITEIMAKTNRYVIDLNLGTQKWAEEIVGKEYERSANKTRISLETLGKKTQKINVDQRTKTIIDLIALLIQRNSSIMKTVDQFLQFMTYANDRFSSVQLQEFNYAEATEELDLMAENAMIEEISRGKLKKQLAIFLQDKISSEGLIDINGKMWRAGKYSQMVARTSLRTAQSKAVEDLCKQYENDLIEIDAHMADEPPDDPCWDYDGKTFSITGNTPGYDVLDQWPPFHPNCTHIASPTSEEAIAIRGG